MKQIRVSSASLVVGLLVATTTSQQQVLASTDDGLRWTMSELVLPAQVTSLAAVGATKDGAIVARGLIGGAVQVCVWLPVLQFGLQSGWTVLGPAAPTAFDADAASSSLQSYAGLAGTAESFHFNLASASGFEQCGVGATEQLSQVAGGWVTAVIDQGAAVGALLDSSAEQSRLVPFRATVTNGMQLMALPFGTNSAVAMDANSSGWVVGLGQSEVGWTGLVAAGATFHSMTGRMRNAPSAVVDSCISVGDDLTIVANIRSGSDTYRVALLSDARADHRPTGTVDVEDLIQYVIDYADQKPAADMDASGAVTCSDCEEYVEVWFAAQAAPPQPPATVDALALHALLTRVLIPGDVPQGLRSAAREQYEDAIAQLAAAVGDSAPTAQPADDCAHVPYDENSSRNWCGTESFNAPDLFPECCAKHDNCYRGRPAPNPLPPDPELPALAPVGGREGCDDQFLDCMLRACETDHGCLIARFGCKLAAGAYHLGVRWFGNKPYCECLRVQDPEECGPPAVANQLGIHASVVLP